MLSGTFSFVKDPVEATASGTNVSLAEGGLKNLSCPVNGNPKPNIRWYKGGEASGNPLSSENVLTVKDIIESLCYTCVASNSLGVCLLYTSPSPRDA